MRSPEEIKKGLEWLGNHTGCDDKRMHLCSYFYVCDGVGCFMARDALAYIQQLEVRMEAFADEALIYIQQLEAQQPRWISVGERLPEDAERVYVALRGGAGGVYIAQYFKNKCQPQEDFWMLENDWEVPASPTHWMPLPQPPEEEKNHE